MKNLIIDLLQQYSNKKLTVREATSLMVINSYYCSSNNPEYNHQLNSIISMLDTPVQKKYGLTIPNLMYYPSYNEWYARVKNIACNDYVDSKKLVELFLLYMPSATPDTPLLEYFGKTGKGRKPSTNPLAIDKDIKPSFAIIASFIHEHAKGSKKATIEEFFEVLGRFDTYAHYLWQTIPNDIKNEPSSEALSCEDIQKQYHLNSKTVSWLELFSDYFACVYKATINKELLECKDLCGTVHGLSGNPTAQKDSTLFEGLPLDLKLRRK